MKQKVEKNTKEDDCCVYFGAILCIGLFFLLLVVFGLFLEKSGCETKKANGYAGYQNRECWYSFYKSYLFTTRLFTKWNQTIIYTKIKCIYWHWTQESWRNQLWDKKKKCFLSWDLISVPIFFNVCLIFFKKSENRKRSPYLHLIGLHVFILQTSLWRIQTTKHLISYRDHSCVWQTPFVRKGLIKNGGIGIITKHSVTCFYLIVQKLIWSDWRDYSKIDFNDSMGH